jgi:NAD(P)H-flavin reductase
MNATRGVITMENHSVTGGLGSAVAEMIAGAGLHGQVTESVRHALEKVGPELGDLAERDVYVAGEPAQVDATRAFLLASGLPSAQLRCWESH